MCPKLCRKAFGPMSDDLCGLRRTLWSKARPMTHLTPYDVNLSVSVDPSEVKVMPARLTAFLELPGES